MDEKRLEAYETAAEDKKAAKAGEGVRATPKAIRIDTTRAFKEIDHLVSSRCSSSSDIPPWFCQSYVVS